MNWRASGLGAGLVPRQQGQSEGDFTPENALRGAPISTWQVQKTCA